MASGDVQSLSSQIPRGSGAGGGAVARPGTGVGKCHRCSSANASVAVRCKTPALAFGFRPWGRNMTLLPPVESVPPRKHIYVLRSSERIRRAGWESRKVLWGAGFSWGQQDKGQGGNVRWGSRRGWGFTALCVSGGTSLGRGVWKEREEGEWKRWRNKSIIRLLLGQRMIIRVLQTTYHGRRSPGVILRLNQ